LRPSKAVQSYKENLIPTKLSTKNRKNSW